MVVNVVKRNGPSKPLQTTKSSNKQTAAKKKCRKDPTKEVWVRDKSKSKALIEYTQQSSHSINTAYTAFNNAQKKGISEGLTKNEEQWSVKRAEETVALYKDNFEQTNLAPHKYERQTTIDQTYLIQNHVPFKK